MSVRIAPEEPARLDAPAAAPPLPLRHVRIIIGLVFAVSILKGLRMPNLWAATHMTFNYSHGFIRRGLVGQVIRFLGARHYNYNLFAFASFALLILVAAVMGRLIKRMLETDAGDLALQGAVLAFAASTGVVFFVHEVGYFDYIGLLALLLFIRLAHGTQRRYLSLGLAVPFGVGLALVHESLVVMFAPTMLFALLCQIVVQTQGPGVARRTRPLLMAAAAGTVLIAFAASTVIGAVGTGSPTMIHALEESIARASNFPLRDDAFDALFRPVRENVLTLMPGHWRDPVSLRYLRTGLVVTFPTVAFLVYYGVRLIRRLALPVVTRWTLIATFVAATLGPLSLNLVGWDSARWNSIVVIAGFCCVACLRLFFPPAADRPTERRVPGPLVVTLAAAAVVLGLCSTNYFGFLFDGYQVQWFPFDVQLDSLFELIRGHFTFMPHA